MVWSVHGNKVNFALEKKDNYMKEKNYRSLVKSLSYRITGTIATFLISYIVTGQLKFALSIMSVDFVSKIVIFYLHERMWNRIKFGKIKGGPEYEI